MKKHLTAILIGVLTACASYFVAAALTINRVVWTLLKDRYYQYMSLFVPLLALCCAVCLLRDISGKRGLAKASLGGIAAGYVASLGAFMLLPIYAAHSAERILTVRDITGVFFLSPLFTLSWVNGLLSMWMAWVIRRALRSQRPGDN